MFGLAQKLEAQVLHRVKIPSVEFGRVTVTDYCEILGSIVSALDKPLWFFLCIDCQTYNRLLRGTVHIH